MDIRWAVLVFLVTCWGCGGAPQPTNTLIYARAGESDGLDPIHFDSGESFKVMAQVFDTLVTFDRKTAEIVPGLAESWETSEDGLTWTFLLRPGVKFHDGTVCDAEAVVYSFQRMVKYNEPPHVYQKTKPYLPAFQMIEEVTAKDELTVLFRLKHPSAVFLPNLTMYASAIVSPAGIQAHGEGFTFHPVGTGPFEFVSWQQDDRLVLKAFDDHWAGRPAIERVIFIPVAEPSLRIEQLKQGAVHLADNLPPEDVALLDNAEGLTVQSITGMNVGYLGIQTEHGPLNHLEVRRALRLAIDKPRLIQKCYGGNAEVAVNPMPKSLWGHHDGLTDPQYDPQAAKRLLQQAAEEYGFDFPVKLTLHVMNTARPYLPEPIVTAQFLKEELAQAGFEITVQRNDIRQHFPRCSAGEHDLCLLGWSTDNADPDNFLHTFLHPDNINDIGGNNTCRYRNAEVAQLLDQAQQEQDRGQRAELYKQVQEIVHREVPMVPLVHMPIQVVHTSRLKEYQPHPTGTVRLRWAELAKP